MARRMQFILAKRWNFLCAFIILLPSVLIQGGIAIAPLRYVRKLSVQHPHPEFPKSRDANNLCSLIVHDLRGGSEARSEDISIDLESASGLMAKLRNVIRSLLEVGEKKAPSLTMSVRSLLKRFEEIFGVELLPPVKKKDTKNKKKKSRSKKDSKKSKDATDDGADDDDASESEKKSIKTKARPSKSKKGGNAEKHLQSKISTTNPNYRIQRELKNFIKDPPTNLKVKVGKNLRVWIVTMTGAENTIYEGETFQLRISFPAQYPTVPPSVYFLPPHIPKHEHVYTNGDICLSLLGKDWRPTMTAQSVAVSILSILSSAQTKSLPMDNAKQAQNKPGEYQKDWVYHDDNC